MATSPRHVTAYLPFTLLCLLLPTEQTAKMLRTKTVRRLFRMEDQPMVKLVNTAGDASKNNGIDHVEPLEHHGGAPHGE